MKGVITIQFESMEELKELFSFTKKEAKEPPEITKEEQIVIKEEVKTREKIDTGKMGALYKAGWEINDIADECKCSRQAVVNNLVKMGLYQIKRRGTNGEKD